jgi:uncharacterized protein YecE (DUF72 family)
MDAAHDPGTAEGRQRSEATALESVRELKAPGGARVLVGIASWTDPSMTARGVFYPDRMTKAEERLKYYSSRFPMVEVDSTYYALPSRSTAHLWAERTPAGFTFNVKAHALMTGQPSEVARLPKDVKALLPESLAGKQRIYATDLPPEILDAVWLWFLDALEPLRESNHMGAILLQFPRWITPTKENAALIEDACRRLEGWKAAVEFRNKLWLEDRLRQRTLDLLRRNSLAFVCVDSPPGFDSSMPAIAEATDRLAVVRFHGRNTDTWEANVTQVSQRFRYLYDETQLREWLPGIRAISEQAEEVHLVFNNCYGNYATTNALETAAMLLQEGFGSQE